MPYTTQGYMTAADMAEAMRDMDMLPESITLGDLARELDATPNEVATFGDLEDWHADHLVSGEDANMIREAWDSTPAEPIECWTPGEYDPTGLLRARDAS